ncbi:preprotein translocase subunit SecG [symbiont of Argiope bruennichi]|uniref:preprotein translocase subunit SecG n=1 Tax=symbiont of Argiope bruennichi TaxID=2810479 RepID=UPI003DA448A5
MQINSHNWQTFFFDFKIFGGWIFVVIIFIIGLALIVFVLLQGGKSQGLGTALTGSTDSNLFKEVKHKESERKMATITYILGTLLFIFCLIFAILIHKDLVTLP